MGGADHAKVRTWAGLDVHAAKVVACVVDAESGEMTVHRLLGTTNELIAFCAGLAGPVRVAYEAGPTGFGLARALTAAGIGCVIAAPGKIERPVQDRVKTDQRDAERLVRLLMIDALHAVRVPGNEEEAIRDLVRAREDLRGDLMCARHRLSKLLLATTFATRTQPATGISDTGRATLALSRRWSRHPEDDLSRPGPVRAQLGRDPPPGRDHEDRLAARPSAAGRSGLALPPPTTTVLRSRTRVYESRC